MTDNDSLNVATPITSEADAVAEQIRVLREAINRTDDSAAHLIACLRINVVATIEIALAELDAEAVIADLERYVQQLRQRHRQPN